MLLPTAPPHTASTSNLSMSAASVEREHDTKNPREGGQVQPMSRICNREGIVWARLTGYRPWPARIISDNERLSEPTFGQADKYRTKEDDTLVFFFGTNDIAWLRRKKDIYYWKAGLNKNFHKTTMRNTLFEKSLDEVRAYCSM